MQSFGFAREGSYAVPDSALSSGEKKYTKLKNVTQEEVSIEVGGEEEEVLVDDTVEVDASAG